MTLTAIIVGVELAARDLPQAEVKAALSQWLVFNHGHHILTLVGWLAALQALSVPADRRG